MPEETIRQKSSRLAKESGQNYTTIYRRLKKGQDPLTPRGRGSCHSRPVTLLDGREFPSIKEAAALLKMDYKEAYMRSKYGAPPFVPQKTVLTSQIARKEKDSTSMNYMHECARRSPLSAFEAYEAFIAVANEGVDKRNSEEIEKMRGRK